MILSDDISCSPPALLAPKRKHLPHLTSNTYIQNRFIPLILIILFYNCCYNQPYMQNRQRLKTLLDTYLVAILMHVKGDKIQSEKEKVTFLSLCFIQIHDCTCARVKIFLHI